MLINNSKKMFYYFPTDKKELSYFKWNSLDIITYLQSTHKFKYSLCNKWKTTTFAIFDMLIIINEGGQEARVKIKLKKPLKVIFFTFIILSY